MNLTINARRRKYIRERDPKFAQPAEKECRSMKDIGGVLRQRRKQLHYTQEDVAKLCGFSKRLIIDMEKGRGTVGIDKVIFCAFVLDTSIFTRLND